MICWVIYVIGFIAVFVHCITFSRKREDVTLGLLFVILFLSVFSWLSILVRIFIWIYENRNDIIVFKKKGE